MSEKQCHFCTSNIKNIDYKNADQLKKFMDPQSRIVARKKTWVCATCQRKLARAIKRARVMGVVPFVSH